MKLRALIAACVLVLAAPAWAQAQQSITDTLLDYPDIHHPVIGERGMVVSQNEFASEVGAEILRRGGNAVDAAVAVGFALAVTLPRAGNLGGDGFMLVRLASGETVALDYRSVAPVNARAEMFLDERGRENEASRYGHSAAAVPGTVAGLAHAHRRWGSLPWADLLAPAIRLADEGVVLTHDASFALRWAQRNLERSQAATRTFFRADGSAYRPGDTLRQPELATTLRAIAEGGADAFYRGEIARQIAASMQAHGGLITLEDLAAYLPVERTPLRANYRGYEVLTTPPPSGGGVSIVQSLNILEQFNLRAMGAGSADVLHVLAETMKLVYADRTRFIGDPDFVEVPIAGLTSEAYARGRARLIRMNRARAPEDLAPGDPMRIEGRETTHVSVADAQGNVVSNTTTLGDSFGAAAMIDGAGFLLNNQMKNFALEYGRRSVQTLSTSPANTLEPGKRMLSTMAPTIVLRDGQAWIVTGTPGGATILNTILQILVNAIDHDMNIAEATHAPRIHQQWRPGDLNMEPGFSPDTVRLLERRGHEIDPEETMGSAQSIMIVDGVFYGAADPRRPGAAAVAP